MAPNRIKPARGAARVDWRNPTTRGLVYWFLLNENGGAGGLGLVGNTAWSFTNGETWKATEIGPGVSLDGTDDYLSFATPNIAAGPEFSVDLWVRPASLTTDTRLLGNNTSATFNFRLNNTSFEFYPNAGGGSWAVLGTSSDIAAGSLVHLVATFTDNTGSLQHDAQGWINGKPGTAVTADIDTGLAVESNVYFGRKFNDSFGNLFAGELVQLRFWNRALTTEEVLGLYREPYGLLRRSRFFSTGSPPVLVEPSAASVATTVIAPTVVLGSLSLTPSAVSSAASVVAPAVAQGALALTPSAAVSIASAVAPTVALGSLVITPSAASAVAASVAPNVALGSLILVPSAATAAAAAVNPTVVLGSLAIAPPMAVAAASVAGPSIGDSLTLSPAAASAAVAVNGPTAVLGSLTITPTPAFCVATVAGGSVVLGSLVVTPGAANARTAVAVTVIGESGGNSVTTFKGMWRGMRRGM